MEKSPVFLKTALKKSHRLLHQDVGRTNLDADANEGTRGSANRCSALKYLRGNYTGLNLRSNVDGEECKYLENETASSLNGDSEIESNAAGFLQYGRLARRPINEGISSKTKAKHNIVVVCPHCGGVSGDFKLCDLCRKRLPSDAKRCKQRTDPRKAELTIGKQLFYGGSADKRREFVKKTAKRFTSYSDPGKKSMRLHRKRMPTEPVILTISSDEEGENGFKDEVCNDMNTINTSVASHQDTMNDFVTKKQKVENGNTENHSSLEESSIEDSHSSLVLDKDTLEFDIYLRCRTIRIGSYKYATEHPIKIRRSGITFVTTPVVGAEYDVHIDMSPKNIVKILCCFCPSLPVLFIFTTPGCAGMIRSRLRMSSKSGPCYDPGSTDDSQKRIAFVLMDISSEAQEALVDIIQSYGSDLLLPIAKATAMDILYRSTPVKVRKAMSSLTSSEHSSTANSPVVRDVIRTRSATTSVITPTNEITLFTYQQKPPDVGGFAITLKDYKCLDEGEFLNDNILDFYLKYFIQNKLSEHDRVRTHLFSLYFYSSLMKIPTSSSAVRHSGVKKWTKNVDIFTKDFIFIPINENSHWFLAVICFPYLVPVKEDPMSTTAESLDKSMLDQDASSSTMEVDGELPNAGVDIGPNLNSTENDDETNEEMDKDDVTSESPASPDNSIVKQPCILIFDSLKASGKTKLIQHLRDYLQVEWKVKKKEPPRCFDKTHMRGYFPDVPQQNNSSDCGIYVFQYVESFFKSPIQDFRLPIKGLKKWFSEEVVGQKRKQLQELILKFNKEQKQTCKSDEQTSPSRRDES